MGALVNKNYVPIFVKAISALIKEGSQHLGQIGPASYKIFGTKK